MMEEWAADMLAVVLGMVAWALVSAIIAAVGAYVMALRIGSESTAPFWEWWRTGITIIFVGGLAIFALIRWWGLWMGWTESVGL